MTTPPVAPPELVEPLTVARLAADLNIANTPEAFDRLPAATKAELELHLRAAIRHAEKRCGPILPREVTVSVALRGCVGVGLMPSGAWPVIEVLSATDRDGAAVTVDVDESGIVSVTPYAAGTVTITARVGFEPIPEDLGLGVLIVASHMYAVAQRVPGQDTGRPPGFGGGAAAAPSSGFAIPNRAATYLGPYEQAVIS